MSPLDSGVTVSVIICTYNRSIALMRTLRSLAQVRIPHGWKVEVIVVDNGSQDATALVVRQAELPNAKKHYVYEPEKGQSIARNTGIGASEGQVILFLDDDVIPAIDWLERMAMPLLQVECDAVVGRIELAEHLRRSWMKPVHKLWLATPDASCEPQLELIGANMGFRRSVLEKVPAFDPELGPGASGFGDDSLFSWQLTEAGFRLRSVSEALVIHHLEPSRLLRSQWLVASRCRGRGSAYLLHHWHHGEVKHPLLRLCYLTAKLRLRRILQSPPRPNQEGCAPWEISYIGNIEMCNAFLKERKRSRNYSKHGLVRLNASENHVERKRRQYLSATKAQAL